MERNDHKGIAQRIFEIENNWEALRDHIASGKKIYIADGVTMSLSCDSMAWYLWYKSDVQKRSFVKIIPTHLGICDIAAVLKAQPWVCL